LAVEGPLVPDCNAPRNEEIKRLTQALNDKLGEYILEHPPGWLWLHRRWPEEVYQKAGV
jgi:KDO2-lipid IV(A) lauroyltransferase